MFILPMDAASEWPVRRIRRHGAKLPRINSVVKIKMMLQAVNEKISLQISPLRSNYWAVSDNMPVFLVWRPKK